MDCNGPLSAVVDALKQHDSPCDLKSVFWHPSQILRAIIDSDVEGANRIKLTSLATEVAISTYAGTMDTEKLDELTFGLRFTGLIDKYVRLKYDTGTCASSAPALSKASSERLANKVAQPMLIIAIGHGGLVASMQTALYSTRDPNADIWLYPIRHSRAKRRDSGLHLPDDEETRHILEMAKGRTVVIHDEDSSSGTTLAVSTRQMRELLPGATVLGIVNEDSRSSDQKAQQGLWWENNVLL